MKTRNIIGLIAAAGFAALATGCNDNNNDRSMSRGDRYSETDRASATDRDAMNGPMAEDYNYYRNTDSSSSVDNIYHDRDRMRDTNSGYNRNNSMDNSGYNRNNGMDGSGYNRNNTDSTGNNRGTGNYR